MDIKLIDLKRAVRIGKSIKERPEQVKHRITFGHWEIDSALGLKTADEPSILTLVEGQTRFTLTLKLQEKKAEYLNEAVKELIKTYPIKSITADNGSEFALLRQLEGIEVYFTHAYSSHKRGSNENFNDFLREFVPKGISLKNLKPSDLESYLQKSCLS